MPTKVVEINIDEIAQEECPPIKITVGGKTYTFDDIPQETMKKMEALDGKKAGEGGLDSLVEVTAEILSADIKDIQKLGSRKFLLLVKTMMEKLNEESQPKNVPGAEATTQPK